MIADFIVDPEELKRVKIIDPVIIQFIDISNINFLGGTGILMTKTGFKFIITKNLAEQLIENKSAIRINNTHFM